MSATEDTTQLVHLTESLDAAHLGAGPMNTNRDAGVQRNYTQSDGSHNQQFNADNVYHYAAPIQAETPPLPTSTVPFLRDPGFVDRAELDELEQKLSLPNARVALVGLGGVGKSQLVLEYCYRIRERSPDTWVFWIHASNAARFEQSLRGIADAAKIPGRKDAKANIFQLVHDRLHDVRKGPWVVVVDSADDAGFLFEPPNTEGNGRGERPNGDTRAWMDFLPICAHGSTILTSRTKLVTSRMTDDSNTIAVQPMDGRRALALLETKLGQQDDKTTAKKLAAALEYMPLAIAQAAAYIKQRAPRCSVEQYLAKFEKSDKSKTSLLDVASGELRRDREAKNSIMLTWQISFEHVLQSRPSAANLLSLMSFFDHQGIPESVLRVEGATTPTYRRNPTDSDEDDDRDRWSQTSADEGFENDIVTLRDYLFISVTPDGTSLEMHRLVQLAVQKWLQAEGQYQTWAERSVRKLDKALPNGKYENWPACRVLYPHARLTLDLRLDSEEASIHRASVLFKAAWFMWEQGSAADASFLARKSMDARSRMLGDECKATLSSQGLLALALRAQGKYDAAEEMNRRALEGWEKVLGKEHPNTLKSINNLALVLRLQGKYEAAEEMNRRALEGWEKVLGKEHPDTLTSINNLALVLCYQGKYEAAEEMNRQALEGREKVLGKEHPDTLSSVHNVGLVLNYQGKYVEAEEMNRRALEGYEKVLGKEHPDTLTGVHNLAEVLRGLGKYEAVEEMNRQALEGREKLLGKEHPDTLTSVHNLAYLLAKKEEYTAAKELYQRAYSGYCKVLGSTHPTTILCYEHMCSLGGDGSDAM